MYKTTMKSLTSQRHTYAQQVWMITDLVKLIGDWKHQMELVDNFNSLILDPNKEDIYKTMKRLYEGEKIVDYEEYRLYITKPMLPEYNGLRKRTRVRVYFHINDDDTMTVFTEVQLYRHRKFVCQKFFWIPFNIDEITFKDFFASLIKVMNKYFD